MKNLLNFKSILGLAIVSMFLISCAHSDKVMTNNLIQKRKYNKGFFIDFKKNNKENLAVKTRKEAKPVIVKEAVENTRNVELTASNNVSESNVVIAKPVAKIEAEESATVVTTPIEENIVVSKKVQKVINKVNKAVEKQNKKTQKNKKGSGKSQLVALLLAAFLGGLGIHRFYLGYTWQGVVQLLTGGACGVWSLIDFIRIIMGSLGPKSGSYSKTL